VLNILSETNMLGCKQVNSPMDANSKMLQDRGAFR